MSTSQLYKKKKKYSDHKTGKAGRQFSNTVSVSVHFLNWWVYSLRLWNSNEKSHLVMPKFIQNAAQFPGVAMQLLSSHSWMWIPPVNGQAVMPEAPALQNVSWFDARVETMYFTSVLGHAHLKVCVIIAQPGDQRKKIKTKKYNGAKLDE